MKLLGCVLQIYPSEFGLKRMEEEEIKGPPELISENPVDIGSSDDDSDDVT